MIKDVKKAVFPVAGLGTRFLPATKASPKEMLPIVDKPLIQYAVEEAIEAGIKTLVFITGRNKRAIQDHFEKAHELESELKDEELIKKIQNTVPTDVTCIYLKQSEALGLGHAVLCAEAAVDNEPFVVILADDLIDGHKKSCISQMIDLYKKEKSSIIAVQQVEQREIHNYGVIKGKMCNERVWILENIVEKPRQNPPSEMGVVGRYLFEPSIFRYIKKIKPGVAGEIQLTDAIAENLKDEKILAYEFQGRRYDCGSKLGYLKATVEYALKHDELAEDFSRYLTTLKK
ncbi:MAG: UTP--glucose-1-phosphate uridylyltransferase GalU [Pseudomonadota bacterium]